MQQRIEAMIVAVQTVQGPLDKFYGLLSDEQKAQINALSTTGQRPARTASRESAARDGTVGSASAGAASVGSACDATQPELTAWPTEAIAQSVKPTDQQRKSLDALQGRRCASRGQFEGIVSEPGGGGPADATGTARSRGPAA